MFRWSASSIGSSLRVQCPWKLLTHSQFSLFRAKNYNATIELYWAPFLAESNSDDAIVHRIADRIVRGAAIEKHARFSKGADILVFNTYLWWMTGQKMKILVGVGWRNFDTYEDTPVETSSREVPPPVGTFLEIDLGAALNDNIRCCKVCASHPCAAARHPDLARREGPHRVRADRVW